MSRGNKYDIPVLMDPRLQKSEYQNPMDIVLYLDKDGKPYKVKNLVDEKNKLEIGVSDLKKENIAMKECIIKLCALVANINSTTVSTQIDTALVINQVDVLLKR